MLRFIRDHLEPAETYRVGAADLEHGELLPERPGIPFQRLNSIVRGRRAVSADTALLLDALTGWDAQIWLALQSKWDLWHAMRARSSKPKVRPLRQTA